MRHYYFVYRMVTVVTCTIQNIRRLNSFVDYSGRIQRALNCWIYTSALFYEHDSFNIKNCWHPHSNHLTTGTSTTDMGKYRSKFRLFIHKFKDSVLKSDIEVYEEIEIRKLLSRSKFKKCNYISLERMMIKCMVLVLTSLRIMTTCTLFGNTNHESTATCSTGRYIFWLTSIQK